MKKEIKDLEVGDSVYTSTVVAYGWNTGKYFEIKEEVVRLTNTQFVTESGRRFKKDRGTEIGAYGSANLEGVDQTKEMQEFKHKISIIDKIYSQSNKINLPISISATDLKTVEDHWDSIDEILKKLKSK